MLAPAQTLVTYAPPGHFLFVRDKTLVAQPFDAKAGKTSGEPISLAEQIGTDSVGLARFSLSREGILGRVQPGTARNKFLATADGQRFLFVAPLGREAMTPTTVVLNWNTALGR